MKKFIKVATIGVLSLSMGVATIPSNTLSVLAKTRAAKVISSKKIKKATYHINAGYIYSSAKLTKKRHNGKNYLKTTFYATKSAHVKKANGKKAVYYYIKNSKGTVKGWAWHGNLTKFNNKLLKQHKSDIKKLVAIVRTMTPDDQDSTLIYFSDIDTNAPYEELCNAIHDMCFASDTTANGKAMSAAYRLFAGRFNSATNASLSALNSRLNEALNSPDGNVSSALYNLGSALSSAVEDLD